MHARVMLPTVVVALAFAAPAGASQISIDGNAVVYTASPGETNSVIAGVSPYSTSCGSLAAPCLTLHDSYSNPTPSAGCEVTYYGLGGTTVACPVPSTLRVDLGDGEDSWWDWDGPTTLDGGVGNDTPIYGSGGDDVLRGGSGNDVLHGNAGDDTLDGGGGDDYLEGIPGGVEVGLDTSGADTYVGGGGADSLTYERRSEDLSLSPDGAANDGSAGEGDDIGTDISSISGGSGNDTMTGNAGTNLFAGGTGDDVLSGNGGDDKLYGGTGADRIDGHAGTDFLQGDDGDDQLTGGPDVDSFYGDAPLYSLGRDTIDARDGNAESIHCGQGIDSANIDANDYVTGTWWALDDQCETIQAGPAAPGGGAGGGGGLAIASVAYVQGRAVVRLTVPSAGIAKVRALSRGLRAGSGRAKATGAGTVRVKLKLTPKARRALGRRGSLPVTVKATFVPTGGKGPLSARRSAKLRR